MLTCAHTAWKLTSAPHSFFTSGKETVENLKISRGQLAPCQESRIKRQQTVSSAGFKVLAPNADFLLASMPSYCRCRPIECCYSQSVSVSVPQDKIRGSAIRFSDGRLWDACLQKSGQKHHPTDISQTSHKRSGKKSLMPPTPTPMSRHTKNSLFASFSPLSHPHHRAATTGTPYNRPCAVSATQTTRVDGGAAGRPRGASIPPPPCLYALPRPLRQRKAPHPHRRRGARRRRPPRRRAPTEPPSASRPRVRGGGGPTGKISWISSRLKMLQFDSHR